MCGIIGSSGSESCIPASPNSICIPGAGSVSPSARCFPPMRCFSGATIGVGSRFARIGGSSGSSSCSPRGNT